MARKSPMHLAGCLCILIIGIVAFPIALSGCGAKLHHFQKAVSEGDDATVERMLDADPSLVKEKGGNGQTALHVAATSGQYQTAEILISYGADVNAVNNDGYSPLDLALRSSTGWETAKVLLRRGAELRGSGAETRIWDYPGKVQMIKEEMRADDRKRSDRKK